jgi:cytoskeletal protein CcmA (bactofilin family)
MHPVVGESDVTHTRRGADVDLSLRMTASMTNTHVAPCRRHARTAEKSRGLGAGRSGATFAYDGGMRWHRQDKTASEVSAAFISEGSEIVGTCAFNGSAVICGRVKGEIQATGTLTVGRTGRVEAQLSAPIVIVEGEVVGRIAAAERIELREHARVRGDLQTPALVIEETAVFEGQTKSVRGPSDRAGDDVADARPVLTTFAAASP